MEHAHGGFKCGQNNQWDKNNCAPYYCDIGYSFDQHLKKCVKDCMVDWTVNFIFEGLSGFIFGILCDYVNLKYLLLFINGVDTLIAFSYYYTFNNSFIYFFITSFTSFSAGGYYPFKDCYLMKVFGTFIYIELSSYVSFLKSFVVTIISPIAYYIETKIEIKDNAYWILFMTLAAMNLIATILGLFINDSPFNYKEKIKKRKKYEEENI